MDMAITMPRNSPLPKISGLHLTVCILLYLALLLPTIDVHGISNDEFIDYHQITKYYLKSAQGWITGSDIDPTQARLPMYLAGVVCSFFDNHSIITVRYISAAMGILTLIAVYLFCLREFDRRSALFATAMLAVSPYFLAFSTVALTEGDMFLACSGAWLMLTVSYWAEKPDLGRTLLVGIMAGITVATKVVAAVWVPALAIPMLALYQRENICNGNKTALALLGVICVGLVILVGGWMSSGASHVANLNDHYDRFPLSVKIGHYLGVLIAWVIVLAGGFFRRELFPHSLLCLLVMMALSLLTFFVLPPVHTTNGSLLQGVYREFFKNSQGLSLMTVYSALAFNFLTVIVKNGILLGIFLYVAVVAALLSVTKYRVFSIPLTLIISYSIFIILAGRAQTFYMIGVMPQLVVLAAFLLNKIWDRSRLIAVPLVLAFSLNIAYDIKVSYPDLHLNGFQWLGERYIGGRSSLGYKGLIQTPSDGTEQVIAWALKNIPEGKRVITFLRYRLMIAQLGPRSNPPFHVRDGLDKRNTIDQADYVLIHINYLLDSNYTRRTPLDSVYVYPFDRDTLHRDFEKVYAVTRAFGIEMASVWKRKEI